MKRALLAALLSALLLLTACGKADSPTPPDNTAETIPPVVETPETPDVPETAPAAEITDLSRNGIEGSCNYAITVPQVQTGAAEADEIINSYYQNQAAKYQDAAAAQDGGSVIAGYLVTYNAGHTLSILRTVNFNDSDTLCAETFNTETGMLYPADALFSEENFSELLIAAVLDQLRDQNTDLFYQNWESLAATAFNKENFYLHRDGYCVFYQAGDLCDTELQILIPWADLSGIAMPPEADMM